MVNYSTWYLIENHVGFFFKTSSHGDVNANAVWAKFETGAVGVKYERFQQIHTKISSNGHCNIYVPGQGVVVV